MAILDDSALDHERIVIRQDPRTGLRAIIAVHNRNLGPAIGGCRMLPYPSLEAALTDVVRLSRGMTYKCAIAGIPYGGGKSVVLADPGRDKTPALLHAMGDFVDELGGAYITSFDAGITLDDVRTMGTRTAHVAGFAPGFGDPAASTALGLLHCLREAWRSRSGRGLAGATVAIQGVGNVGRRLAALLAAEGARLILADTDPARLAGLDGAVAAPDRIHAAEADIFAPCALGAGLNAATIPEIRAQLVVGGANNQLATPADADRLQARGILYCPDYLANAGGIVELHHQRSGGTQTALAAHLESLAATLAEVLAAAARSGRTPAAETDRLAEARFRPSRS